MDLRADIGKRLRELRKQRGYTQEQAAVRVGKSWQYIGAIERGERAITIDTLQDLCLGLNFTPAELICHEELRSVREIEALLLDTPPRHRARFLAVIRENLLLLREAAAEASGKRRS